MTKNAFKKPKTTARCCASAETFNFYPMWQLAFKSCRSSLMLAGSCKSWDERAEAKCRERAPSCPILVLWVKYLKAVAAHSASLDVGRKRPELSAVHRAATKQCEDVGAVEHLLLAAVVLVAVAHRCLTSKLVHGVFPLSKGQTLAHSYYVSFKLTLKHDCSWEADEFEVWRLRTPAQNTTRTKKTRLQRQQRACVISDSVSCACQKAGKQGTALTTSHPCSPAERQQNGTKRTQNQK